MKRGSMCRPGYGAWCPEVFIIIALLAWAVLLGLLARRFGPSEETLLLVGIIASVAIQYFVFGPS